MQEFVLTGKTQKGKNRVREHGRFWHRVPVPASKFQPNRVLLESAKTKYAMWVRVDGLDENFDVDINERT